MVSWQPFANHFVPLPIRKTLNELRNANSQILAYLLAATDQSQYQLEQTTSNKAQKRALQKSAKWSEYNGAISHKSLGKKYLLKKFAKEIQIIAKRNFARRSSTS